MALDTLAQRDGQLQLFERYGRLLTPHQRRVLELYLARDWSLAEIAQSQGTSRAAVHDLIRRSGEALRGYERSLGLLARERRREQALARLRREAADLSRRLARLQSRLEGI